MTTLVDKKDIFVPNGGHTLDNLIPVAEQEGKRYFNFNGDILHIETLRKTNDIDRSLAYRSSNGRALEAAWLNRYGPGEGMGTDSPYARRIGAPQISRKTIGDASLDMN